MKPDNFFIAALIFAAVQIAGCATTQPDCPPPKIVDTACKWAQPIQVSKDDTPDTKRAALAAWKAWRTNCP